MAPKAAKASTTAGYAKPAIEAAATKVSTSLSAMWVDIIGSGSEHALELAPNLASLEVADVTSFVASLEDPIKDWTGLFTKVPTEHERRKEALAGVLKIKSAAKQFEKIDKNAASIGGSGESDSGNAESKQNDKQAKDSADGSNSLSELLIECQSSICDMTIGLLEVSFPVHEFITGNDFEDALATSAAIQRMQVAVENTSALGKLFAKAKIDPKKTAKSANDKEEPLAPEVLKMLEKSMNKQKKKDKKKGNAASNASNDASEKNLKEAWATWEKSEGRCSCVLGEEVWEGLNWHRGMFLFGYIQFLLGELCGKQGENEKDGDADVTADEAASRRKALASRALFADAMRSYHQMLIARGPIAADHDDPAMWQVSSDGPHTDETARMFYHGIYSGTHLRALKHLAELSYWQWKHDGKSETDGKLAALINRKFVHVVRHIMPHAGWTADVEYERIVEVETTILGSSEFSNGLNDKQVVRNSNSKIGVVAENSKSKSGKADKGADKGGKGSAVSSTAPAED